MTLTFFHETGSGFDVVEMPISGLSAMCVFGGNQCLALICDHPSATFYEDSALARHPPSRRFQKTEKAAGFHDVATPSKRKVMPVHAHVTKRLAFKVRSQLELCRRSHLQNFMGFHALAKLETVGSTPRNTRELK